MRALNLLLQRSLVAAAATNRAARYGALPVAMATLALTGYGSGGSSSALFCTSTSSCSSSDENSGAAALPATIGSEPAAALDRDLMSASDGAYSLDQLMELAGLSVATAFDKVYDKSQHVLVFCGPGNNGGDGMVAARHLALWGYDVTVVVPKIGDGKKAFFELLLKQCENAGVSVLKSEPENGYESLVSEKTVLVDAVFGFSASGPPRPPYEKIVPLLHKTSNKVLSVDIPSGWDVDKGDVRTSNFVPDVLVSLTAIKEGCKNFKGRHFVGGRFLPDDIARKYGVEMPPYEASDQVFELVKKEREKSDNKVVVYITAPSEGVAESIASELVGSGSAACVNITPGIKSVYKWKGAIEKDAEVLMMVKTTRNQLKTIEAKVNKLHPYDTPELIVLDIVGGSKEYLDWIDESVK